MTTTRPLAELFAIAAERDFAASSPFYRELSLMLVAKPELTELLDRARPGQRRPILLFAAVHDTLLAHPEEPLADWYASLRTQPRPVDNTIIDAWADLLGRHGDSIAHKVATRSVQTNEVNRCVALTLAYAKTVARAGDRPVALVELGTSAGLNLHFDRYAYILGAGRVGPVDAPVTLAPEFRGQVPVFDMPKIPWRLGVDREPIDPTDPESARWLLAGTWPDQTDRFTRLRAALRAAALSPQPVRTGDIVADLPDILRGIPDDHVPIIAHSWVLWYIAKPDRLTIGELLAAEAERRGGLAWVHAEAPGVVPGVVPPPRHPDDESPVLVGTRWSTGDGWHDEWVCWTHGHGTWLRAIV